MYPKKGRNASKLLRKRNFLANLLLFRRTEQEFPSKGVHLREEADRNSCGSQD